MNCEECGDPLGRFEIKYHSNAYLCVGVFRAKLKEAESLAYDRGLELATAAHKLNEQEEAYGPQIYELEKKLKEAEAQAAAMRDAIQDGLLRMHQPGICDCKAHRLVKNMPNAGRALLLEVEALRGVAEAAKENRKNGCGRDDLDILACVCGMCKALAKLDEIRK